MANPDRWLKPVPSSDNVSQSDVARIAREKRQRQEHEQRELVSKDALHSLPLPEHQDKKKRPTPPTPRTPPTSPTARTPPPSPTAPERDFARVANSIVRDAIAGGYFTGKSKQLYDYLYSRTRGAITPLRSIRVTKPLLMKGASIGSERTLLKNLAHLKNIGLIQVNVTDGEHSGNEYTVFLPEEIGLPRTPPTPPTPPTAQHLRHAPQKVGYVPPLESGVGGVGSSPEESTTYEEPKTSFKTNTENDDDEARATVRHALEKMIAEVTGREATATEYRKLLELVEVIALEAKIAAGRTTVSSAGPFLAEHLRRRLFKKDKEQMAVETSAIELPAPTIDPENCMDCSGTGWYYPEGKEKGITRCKHARLAETKKDS